MAFVVMTVHVLHAGNGYDYLTRQVAHGDAVRGRGQDLADYYTAQGAPPGLWMGSGVASLAVEGTVHEHQMKALFGEGLHPEVDAMIARQAATWAASFQLQHGRSPGDEEIERARDGWIRGAQLGRRYPQFDTAREEAWRKALDERLEARCRAEGITTAAAPREMRAEARREVGMAWFARDRGREPVDEGELKKFIAQASRPTPQPVAGYDLVFTPSKSVSVLWGIGDHATRQAIEAAHDAAVVDAIGYLEKQAAFTRTGAGGVAQVDSCGLVATGFKHFDSRAGDPNLHTHVAVANKVQGPDGRWRSLDGRVLYSAGVSASERYNAAVEREIVERLGVRFEDRTTGRDKRPVREVAGVDARLLEMFSSRRNAIEERFDELRAQYRAEHGHEPSKAAQHHLAQQATLDTRSRKAENESLADKAERWVARAAELGHEHVLENLVQGCRDHAHGGHERDAIPTPADLAASVVDRVSFDRSTWKVWHLRAEAERQIIRIPGLTRDAQHQLLEEVVAVASDGYSVLLEAPAVEAVPAELARSDGSSVFRVHGDARYSSAEILRAETRLLDAAATPAAAVVDPQIFEAITGQRDTRLDPGQRALVRHFATTESLLAVGVGPAGAGKSTAMGELAEVVRLTGRRVVGVAPSAVAAQGLADEINSEATTIAKLLHTAANEGAAATGLRAGDLLLVDEAGMAGTRTLDQLVDLARTQGCVVRLLGDPSQLAAVEAGGAFRLLVHRTDAVELTTLHRFRDPAEAAATLAVRDGDTAALDFYEDAGRLHSGSRDGALEQLYGSWLADRAEGKTSLMLASDSATVRELSTRARLDRVAAGEVNRGGVPLRDGSTAGAGDLIVTRRNDRRLATAGGRDFVKNGDIWEVLATHSDGSLQVRHSKRGGAALTLPATYVRDDVELGYALTVHRAQGVTVDRSRTLVDERMTRESAYVATTRGREENHCYVVTDSVVDVDLDRATGRDRTARHVLEDVLRREGGERSASETVEHAYAQAESLEHLVPEYEHGRGAAAVHTGSVDRILIPVLGEEGLEQLREDPAWHALADRVAALVDEGRDAAAVVQAAVDVGPLEDAHSAAAVLTWRINQGSQRGGLEDWMRGPEPSGAESAAGLEGWLAQRRERIQRRVEDVTSTTYAEKPEWLVRAIGEPPPAASPESEKYLAAVRAAAVYRDRYGVNDSRAPLGQEPSEGRQLRDWRRAGEALEVAKPGQPAEARSNDLAERARQLRERTARGTTSERRGPVPDRDVAAERRREAEERQRQQSRDDLER